MPRDFLTVEQAASYAGVPVKWITNRMTEPDFPKRRKGVHWVIPVKPLDDYLVSHVPTKRRFQ